MEFELNDLPEMPDPSEHLDDDVYRELTTVQEEVNEMGELTEAIVGELEDTDNWHPQAESMSCAVSVQEIIAEQLLEREFSEQAVIEYAEAEGWYDPETGTSMDDTGNILESMGLEVDREYNENVSDLVEALDNGDKIIVAVDNMTLADPRYAEIPGRSANHAVQVVAIDFSDTENPQVILNDTGVPDGQGIRHDLDIFVAAWNTSDNFAVYARKGM